MKNVLDIKDLTIGLTPDPDVRIVRNLDLSIAKGETVALVGESGSGKSMTALAILGLLPQAIRVMSGEIQFQSDILGPMDLAQAKPKQLNKLRGREIGMIFQEPMSSFSLVHRVGDQVGEPLTQHFGLRKRAASLRAAELLEQVGVRDADQAVKRYPFEFSGGMLQRAMIARAIACGPKLIVADEPTTALDVTIQAQVLELLAQIQRDVGAGMLFVTHDLAVASQIADRVLVMQHGRLVEEGPTSNVLQHPKEEYTQALVAAVPKMETRHRPTAPLENQPVPVLTIKGVDVSYSGSSGFLSKKTPPKQVLSEVSVQMHRGTILGLVGESGSGKTTLARAALGLVPISRGTIEFHDAAGGTHAIHEQRPSDRIAYWRKAQMVFQNPYASLNPWRTVEETLIEPVVQHGLARGDEARKRARIMLEKCGMPGDAMSRFPHAFSGGQRQRIAIARALVVEPELVLCDEPLSALDVSTQARIIALLRQLRQEMNLSILLISHDLAVTSSLCDEVVVMQNGKIVEVGRTHDIFSQPKVDYTAQLIAAVPRLEFSNRRTSEASS